MDLDWHAIISAGISGLGVTGIAKFFIQRSADKFMDQLEELPEKFAEIKSQLAVISIQLSHIEQLRSTIQEHDRAIARLNAKIP